MQEDRAEILRFGCNLIFYNTAGHGHTPPPPPHQQPSMAAPAGTFGALPPHLTPNTLPATGAAGARAGAGMPTEVTYRQIDTAGNFATAQLQIVPPYGAAGTMNSENAEAPMDDNEGGEVVGVPAEDGATIGGGRREPGLSYADSEELASVRSPTGVSCVDLPHYCGIA